jgi:hypothetical protein
MAELKEGQALSGIWWVPAQPGVKVAGTLSCEPGEWPRLSLIGGLVDSFSGPDRVDLVIGYAGTALITLLDCVQAKMTVSAPDITTQELVARTVLRGVGFEAIEEVRFDRAVIEVTHLDDWANLNGFQETVEADGEGPTGYTLTYRPPEELEAQIPGGRVSIGVNWTRRAQAMRQREVEQRATLKVDLDEAVPLNTLVNRYVQPLRNLVTLAVGAPSTVTSLRVSRKDLLGPGDRRAEAEVEMPKVFPPPGGRTRAPAMLFTVQELDFAERVPGWLALVDRLDAPCNLLFGLQYAPPSYAEYRLLTAVAAAEALHRRLFPGKTRSPNATFVAMTKAILSAVPQEQRKWLKDELRWANQPKLRDRLMDLLELAGPAMAGVAPDYRSWSQKVARVRNDLTHWDPGQPIKLNGAQLFWLANAVAAVVKVCLLRELGFGENDCAALLARNSDHQHLVSQLQHHLGSVLGS